MARSAVSDSDRVYGQRLGAYFRELRVQRGRSAQQVAEAAGLSVDTVRSIETGRIKSPSFVTVARIAAALDVGLDEVRGTIGFEPGGGRH